MLNAPSHWTGLTEFIWGVGICLYCATLGAAFMQGMKLVFRAQPSPSEIAPNPHPAIVFFLAASTGLAMVCQLLFVLGLAKLLTPSLMTWSLLGAFLVASAVLWRCPISFKIQKNLVNLIEGTATTAAFLSIGLTLTWLCIKPPGMWDDTSYHLPYAKHYLQAHQLSVNPWLRFPLFPHNGNLLFTWALSWGGEIRAQVMATAIPLTLTAMGLYGACQQFLKSRLAGWLAVGLLWSLSPIKETLGYAYIDNLLMMFCWAAMLAMAMALNHKLPTSLWFVVCGLLAGTAAGTKLFGAVVVIMIGCCFMLSAGWRTRAVWLYAGTAALFGLGWYVRSFIISGDPVHPAGGNLFGHYLWNAADLLSQQQEQATHGTSKNPLLIITSLQKAGLLLIGPALLALSQPRLWGKATRALALLVLFYMLAWQTTSQVARYTAPVLPAAAFLTLAWLFYAGPAEVIHRLDRWMRPLNWAAMLLVIAAAIAWPYSQRGAANEASQHWHQSLENRTGYKVMQAANAMSDKLGPVLVQIGYENAVYFFDGVVIGDWFGPGRYSQMLDCTAGCQVASAESIRALLHQHKANMLAINRARFQFAPASYATLFDIHEISKNDYLLTLKKPSSPLREGAPTISVP